MNCNNNKSNQNYINFKVFLLSTSTFSISPIHACDIEELQSPTQAIVGHHLQLDVSACLGKEGELLQWQGVLLLSAVLQSFFNHFFPRSTLTHGTSTSKYNHEEHFIHIPLPDINFEFLSCSIPPM